MQLKSYRKNMNAIEYANGVIVLFSYQTPVAAFVPGRGILKSSTRYSVATSRHINEWEAAEFSANTTVTEVSQSDINNLIK